MRARSSSMSRRIASPRAWPTCAIVFGAEREAVLARELTKLFETVLGEPLAELAARVVADPDQQRGEHA